METSDRKWFLGLLRSTEEKKWCTKITCTTCGATDFRRELKKNIDTTSQEIAQKETISAILSVTDGEVSALNTETIFQSLGLIFYEVGIWSPFGKAHAEIPLELKDTWAEMFFRRIQPEIDAHNRRKGYV